MTVRRLAACLLGLALLAGLPGAATGQHARGSKARAAYALAAPKPGTVDVYILSLGLWGEQRVFEREAKGAAQILESRFGETRHAIVLFNTRTRMNVTDASARAAASAVGRALDPGEDVAVLFLTSHGTPDGLAVTTRGRSVQLMPPAYVRGLLDEMRARLRVLIVSACYSGVFAKALADDDTLVITAAAADKPSFGCEDRATWTYFGDAFFNQALRREASLDAAFARARDLVTRRERREGFDPSDPQIAGGANVLKALAGRMSAAEP
jgi:hypothetical protein